MKLFKFKKIYTLLNLQPLDTDNTEETTPALELYGTDLTLLAKQGKLEECFGREQELLDLMEILVRRQKNNPVLIGEAGVGKTAIVELFATKIIKNLVPFVLEGRTIISVDMSRIIAGAKYRGDFESRLQRLLKEVLDQPNVIIFIDEIHNITGAGSSEGSLDAANMLKPILSRSGFQCIGATTIKEYQRIEKDPALNRRFQPILVKEPSIDDTIKILYGIRPSLEVFHNVEIHPSAIILAAELSSRYIHDRFLPDKAIDLLDRAAAKEVIKLTNITEGSVITSIINNGLKHIGKLRLEAFRRSDIASEFVFKEIENAYKNFLLKWIETPLNISKEPKTVLSPISQELYNKMRLSVLCRIDELLFASNKSRFISQKNSKIINLSSTQNNQIYFNTYFDLNHNNLTTLSLYRISLLLFIDWQNNKLYKEIPNFKNILIYIKKLRNENPSNLINKQANFNPIDCEIIEENIEIISELEEKRIEIFKNYLLNLKPLIRKGILESLKYSSQLSISNKELGLIYNLLGHSTYNSNITFLENLQDPILLNKAKKLGNFTGLKKQIKQKEIHTLLAQITGIPTQTLSVGESQKLLNLESILHKAVIGQDEAVSAIAKAIRRARLGIQKANRPLASFLFCGPTGVGKTEVTKALAKTMFGSTTDMIRFDMSEFMEKFTISRLIGSPPGYVGYEDGGQLTDAVRLKPYSVVLFDELEKAHTDILNILLQILEDGRLTDSQKRLIHFDNTIIIMTSNAAAEDIQQLIKKEQINNINTTNNNNSTINNKYENNYTGAINFLKSPINENFLLDIKQQLKNELEISFRNLQNSQIKNLVKLDNTTSTKTILMKLKEVVLERLSTLFLPEFLNRLDDIIIFQPLKQEELRKICDIMVNEVIDRVKTKNIILTVDENVKMKLSKEGYNPLFGARPLRRLITKYIEDLISENMLKNFNTKVEQTVKIILNENNQVIIK